MNEVGAVLLTGLVGAAIAVWAIMSQRAVARRRATLDQIARSQADSDLIAARKEFVRLSTAAGGLGPWADQIHENSDEVKSIRLVLNELELMAIGMQRGIIEYELYKRWNRSGVIRYWTYAAPFIVALRGRLGNEAIYHEFEEMMRWMKESRMPKRNKWLGNWF